MTSAILDNLVRIGKLKPFPANRSEFEHLLGLARTLLGTVTTSGTMATESQFILAYDSAHAASRAALRAHGYPSDERYLVFQCLEHTSAGRSKNGACLTLVTEGAMRPNTKAI